MSKSDTPNGDNGMNVREGSPESLLKKFFENDQFVIKGMNVKCGEQVISFGKCQKIFDSSELANDHVSAKIKKASRDKIRRWKEKGKKYFIELIEQFKFNKKKGKNFIDTINEKLGSTEKDRE